MKILMRPDLKKLQAYKTNEIVGNVRMDANENPFSWPEGMKEEVLNSSLEFNRYPDGQAKTLRKAIASYNQVDETEVLTGNGSDELIQLILNTFAGPGSSVIVHPPTFSMYWAAAAITGTVVTEVPLIGGVDLDTSRILQNSAQPGRKVVIICNPNNPTGSLFPKEEIMKVVRGTDGLVLVDEAYFEFSGETLANLINKYPNLLILRTFSKAFGLAALRLGYVLGNADLIASLDKVRQPYNVNAFSQQAGIVAIKYLPAYQSQVSILKEEIRKLAVNLSKIPGIKVFPSAANFLLFSCPDSQNWTEELINRGFTPRYFPDLPILGEAIRVSSATPEQNQAFLKNVKEIAGA